MSPRDVAEVALFSAVLVVCTWLAIPLPIPFTMQTFAVLLAAGLLGGKKGTWVVVVYILMGVAGLPVFSGFGSGIGKLLGPTGGYIIGFLLTTLVMWAFERCRSPWALPFSMVLGMLACYAAGTVWFVVVYAQGGGAISFSAALAKCVLPFIPADLTKLVMAYVMSERLSFLTEHGRRRQR